MTAEYFTQIKSNSDIKELVGSGMAANERRFILGRGAKVLFSKNYEGLVINMDIRGKKVIKEDNRHIWLEVSGGEDWPKLVEYTVSQGWGGLENLALIPGTAGAAPVQNIGAYGKSLEDAFVSLETTDLTDGKTVKLSKEECKFGYRDSIFKHELADNHLITKITVKLEKTDQPNTIKDTYQTVVRTRRNKLPNITVVGSVGCFFKNPIISQNELRDLQKLIPNIQCYPTDTPDQIKVPAGWLLEEIGWKGKRVGNVGTWDKHALIVVNYSNAAPQELLDFTEAIRQDFYDHYRIKLENEAVVV